MAAQIRVTAVEMTGSSRRKEGRREERSEGGRERGGKGEERKEGERKKDA